MTKATIEHVLIEQAKGLGNVIAGGYCIGCGACSAIAPEAVGMSVDAHQMWQATPLLGADIEALASGGRVCPFSSVGPDEDALAAKLFPEATKRNPLIGRYEVTYVGRTADESEVKNSSSGGLTSHLLERLLDRGEIDGVIHVATAENRNEHGLTFEYSVSHSKQELLSKRKSQYQSVEFSRALNQIRGNGKRYAFVGVPCFVKALRLMGIEDKLVSNQFRYMFALVCGHMKSHAFAELLAWQVGVPPSSLARVDFRAKVEGAPSTDYEFSAWAKDGGERHYKRSRDLFGAVWGHAFFQPMACDYCDDVFGELSDASFGDAWLPGETSDWRGANIVVIRNPSLVEIFASDASKGVLELRSATVLEVLDSQAGNIRHRRDGLALRLDDSRRRGVWVPRKRVMPNGHSLPILRRGIVRVRQGMARRSHSSFLIAKQANDLNKFKVLMWPMVMTTKALYRATGWRTRISAFPFVRRVVATASRLQAAVREALT